MDARSLIPCLALVAGCGPSAAGTGSVSGADGFKVKSALSNTQVADGGISTAVFFLTDVDTNCADVTHRGSLPFSKSALVGDLTTEGLLGPAVAQVDGGVTVAAAVLVRHPDGTDQATDGTVDVSALDGTHVVGTITVTISAAGGPPGQLTAAFDAPICAAVPL